MCGRLQAAQDPRQPQALGDRDQGLDPGGGSEQQFVGQSRVHVLVHPEEARFQAGRVGTGLGRGDEGTRAGHDTHLHQPRREGRGGVALEHLHGDGPGPRTGEVLGLEPLEHDETADAQHHQQDHGQDRGQQAAAAPGAPAAAPAPAAPATAVVVEPGDHALPAWPPGHLALTERAGDGFLQAGATGTPAAAWAAGSAWPAGSAWAAGSARSPGSAWPAWPAGPAAQPREVVGLGFGVGVDRVARESGHAVHAALVGRWPPSVRAVAIVVGAWARPARTGHYGHGSAVRRPTARGPRHRTAVGAAARHARHPTGIGRAAGHPRHRAAVRRATRSPRHHAAVRRATRSPRHHAAVRRATRSPRHHAAVRRATRSPRHPTGIRRAARHPRHHAAVGRPATASRAPRRPREVILAGQRL